MIKNILLAIGVLFFTGCAAGTYFTWEQAKSVKVGMAKEDLFRVMGDKPYSIITVDDNKTIYTWSYSESPNVGRAVSYEIIDNNVTKISTAKKGEQN